MKPAVLAAVLLAPLSAACLTDASLATDRELRIGEAADADADAWAYDDGTALVVAPGQLRDPEPFALRVDVLHHIDGAVYGDAVAMGSIELVGGSACRLVTAARCDGDACVAELVQTAPGVCLVRVRVATPDGETLSTCWSRARWEGDPADATLADELARMADNQRAACEAAL
ncbi:MAG: hypothetical protein R3B06_26425 [Kofleriaceae bacterium]